MVIINDLGKMVHQSGSGKNDSPNGRGKNGLPKWSPSGPLKIFFQIVPLKFFGIPGLRTLTCHQLTGQPCSTYVS